MKDWSGLGFVPNVWKLNGVEMGKSFRRCDRRRR